MLLPHAGVVAALREGAPARVPAFEAVAVLELLEAAKQSAETGGFVATA